MQPRALITAAVVVLLAAAIAGAGICLRHASAPRIVALTFAPDGTELRVVQSHTVGIEFRTEVYYRRPNGPWGWFYYDEDDWYWGQGRAEVDTEAKRISLYRGECLTATFDWESERYRLVRPNCAYRECIGAQFSKSPPL